MPTAMDFDDFDQARRPPRANTNDLLVLSADGKGIVTRPDALRTATATKRARAGPKPKARLAGGETLNHKRMAEIGAVYDATPALRTPADILTSQAPEGHEPAPGPVATNKWLTASVVKAPAEVITRVFEEAERRDPKHRRPLGRAGGRRQPPDPTDPLRSQATRRQRQRHDRR